MDTDAAMRIITAVMMITSGFLIAFLKNNDKLIGIWFLLLAIITILFRIVEKL